MQQPQIVSRDEWLAARKQLLTKEKELTRLHDQLSAERRALPWVHCDHPTSSTAHTAEQTLADLFDGRSQLIVKTAHVQIRLARGLRRLLVPIQSHVSERIGTHRAS